MKKAIYFNSRLAICKTVSNVLNLDQAQQVLENLCKKFKWNPKDVTAIKLIES